VCVCVIWMHCIGQVVSLRQQIEALRQVRVGVSVCGPDAPCALKLEQMEKEHRERLQKIHDEHERECREIETDKQRLLQEEAKNAVQGQRGPQNISDTKGVIKVIQHKDVKFFFLFFKERKALI